MKTLLHHLSQNTATGEVIPAAEAFVLMTLAFFAGMVVAVACGAWVIHRRTTRPKPHRQLLMEMQDAQERPSEKKVATPTLKAWEQDSDWWKKADR